MRLAPEVVPTPARALVLEHVAVAVPVPAKVDAVLHVEMHVPNIVNKYKNRSKNLFIHFKQLQNNNNNDRKNNWSNNKHSFNNSWIKWQLCLKRHK